MVDVKKLDELATIGRDFIGLQFRLTPGDMAHSIDELWVLGYCFGVLDAVGKTARLEQPTEELALIAIGFFRLMADEGKAANLMTQALRNQGDARFAQGSLRGEEDMFAWLADTTRVPGGLSDYLVRLPSGHLQ